MFYSLKREFEDYLKEHLPNYLQFYNQIHKEFNADNFIGKPN